MIMNGMDVSEYQQYIVKAVNKHRTLKTLYDLAPCIMYEFGS
jgi:hypothetical protein